MLPWLALHLNKRKLRVVLAKCGEGIEDAYLSVRS